MCFEIYFNETKSVCDATSAVCLHHSSNSTSPYFWVPNLSQRDLCSLRQSPALCFRPQRIVLRLVMDCWYWSRVVGRGAFKCGLPLRNRYVLSVWIPQNARYLSIVCCLCLYPRTLRGSFTPSGASKKKRRFLLLPNATDLEPIVTEPQLLLIKYPFPCEFHLFL